MAGTSYGRAAGSLKDASWLSAADQGAARVGASGEQRTATLLDQIASSGAVTVLHDLRVPSSKYKANIDHVVVSGNRVFVIDSKVWKPAFYWTLNGKTRRGLSRFKPAEKQTMVVITNALEAMFAAAGVDAVVETPLLFVWPSSKRDKLTTWALTVPGARVVAGAKVAQVAERLFTGRAGKRADEAVVAQLRALLLSGSGVVNAPARKIADLNFDAASCAAYSTDLTAEF